MKIAGTIDLEDGRPSVPFTVEAWGPNPDEPDDMGDSSWEITGPVVDRAHGELLAALCQYLAAAIETFTDEEVNA